MSRWMWQATASVVRELFKSGHAKIGTALFAFVVVCSTGVVATAVLVGGKAASTGIDLAKAPLEHKGGVAGAKRYR